MSWTELDQQADQAARAWEAESGGWPGVAADQAFRAGWKAAAVQVREQIAAETATDAQRMADIALAGYERGEVSLTVLAEMYGLPPDEMQQQATDNGYWVEWMTPLLTEASGAAHGQLNERSLREVLQRVPEPFLRRAGLLQFARSSRPVVTESGQA